MPSADIISFLSLIVALSAYIAVIRLRIIDRIGDPTYATKKTAYKRAAKTLTLADAPLIISGALLFFHGFWTQFFSGVAPAWFLPSSIHLFAFAGIVLILHHFYSWYKSFTAK